MKQIIKNKRAQVFTLLAISIITLMFVSFEIFSVVEQRQPIKMRISSMDSFLFSLEENLERQVYISGFRIIFLAEEEILRKGIYISDIDAFFGEAFFNGTVNGETKDVLTGAVYNDLIASINEKASKINVEISLKNPRILVSQDDPWHIKFTFISDFIMRDKAGLARWEKEENISAYIPISNFEDPIYTINTNAKIARKINRTIYEGIYIISGNSSNLFSHVNKNYYAENSGAPNFLKRLGGDLSADENGIESFVNLNELSREGIPIKEKSSIDYIYFSSNNPPYQSVSGMPSWFKIDDQDNHLFKYNISG